MNVSLDLATIIIENLYKRVKYLEDHLTPEEYDKYEKWVERGGLKE